MYRNSAGTAGVLNTVELFGPWRGLGQDGFSERRQSGESLCTIECRIH